MMKEQESLDGYLANRVIKLEQKIAAKYGKNLGYKETDSYKNFSLLERRKVDKYLSQNKIKKIAGLFGVGIFGTLSILANNKVTGNVLKNNVNGEGILMTNSIIIYVSVGLILVGLSIYLFKKILRRRFARLFNVVEKPSKQKHI